MIKEPTPARGRPTLRWHVAALAALLSMDTLAPLHAATLVGCDDLAVDAKQAPHEVYAFGAADVELTLRHVGTEPLRIRSIHPRRPPGRAAVETPGLAPGESTRVHIVKPVEGRLGLIEYGFPVVIEDEPQSRVCMLRVPVFVESAYRPEVPVLALDDVEQGKPIGASIDFLTHEAPALRILSVEGLPAWITHTLPRPEDPQAARIQLQIAESAPRGYYSGALRVKTDLVQQPWLQAQIALSIFGDVVPSKPRLDLAGEIQGEPARVPLELKHRKARDFSVKRVVADDARVTATSAPCGEGCIALEVALDTSRLGQVHANLQVDLDGDLGSLVIPVTALVTTAENAVIEVGDPDKAPVKIKHGGERR